ncbi:nSTAND1 domain-containing NTPase [Streptomyces sp. NPDC055210]
MVSLFISHSSQDRAVAEQVAARLRTAGFEGLFLDFDPDLGIPVGREWEPELYTQLRRADGVVFLASAASSASQWCFGELSLARSLGRPVFPVQLDDTPRLSLLKNVQWVDLRQGESALGRLMEGLRRAGLEAWSSFAWDTTRCPYPGLEPFASDDAAVFFGRDRETQGLLELLQPTLQHTAGRFVAILGPSGSGKSSLLHAGVLPRLSRRPRQWEVVSPFRPGRDPVRNLARALELSFVRHDHPRACRELERELRQGPAALVELAAELLRCERADGGDQRRVMIVADQLEELLTLSGAAEQHFFLELLGGALSEESPLWVLATARSEFLTTSPERAGLTEVIDDSLVVEPLSRARLAEVIDSPARYAGLDFAPGLVARMVEETTGGDALSLLAYTLRELYERAGRAGVVTASDYEVVGGVVGALRRRADSIRDELVRHGKGATVLPTLLKLAAVEGEQEPTRRRVPYSTLADDERDVVDAFIEARLLIRRSTADEETVVEAAHESLLRQWGPLHEAVEASRHTLRLRSELERLAADWDRGGQEESYLLRRGRLAVFQDWAAVHAGELGLLEQRFLSAGQELATREIDEARRSNRRLRRLLAGLAVLTVLTVLASVLAYVNNQQAQSRARLALSRQLGTQSDQLVGSRPDLAVLVGLQSLGAAHADRPEPLPSAGLVSGLARLTHASRLLPHPDQVQSASFSTDGDLIATCGWDGAVRLWDARTGAPRGALLADHSGAVMDVAFAPSGRVLATAGWDGTVRLWDVATRTPRGRPIKAHPDAVRDVAFAPSGRLIATAGRDGTVRLWDVATRTPRGRPITAHPDGATGVAFSPNSRMLATSGWDNTGRLWHVGSRDIRPARALRGHEDWLRRVEFSPDGRSVATSSADGTARVWDVRTGRSRKWRLSGHGQDIWAVAFSPEGTRLATAGGDGTVRLWDAKTGQQLGQPLTGHTNLVNQAVFSPDGRSLLTTSWDRSARLWDVTPTYSVSRSFVGHRGDVNGVAISPNGKLLATAGEDTTVRLWKTGSGETPYRTLRGHADAVYRVAFSPDGRLLASASLDGTVRLWDVYRARPRGKPLSGHGEGARDVAFSPDGTVLASAAGDARVRLWAVATHRLIGAPLAGHGEAVNGVAFSPHGETLASVGEDQVVLLWDVASRRRKGKPMKDHSNAIRDVTFSPDGKLVATASADHTVGLWDIASGRSRGSLTGNTASVEDVAFSPDGRLLASAGEDGTLRFWEVATRRSTGLTLTGHHGEVYSIAFGSDGRHVASGGADGSARIWDRSFTGWVEAGCRLVNRNLTQDEWKEYVQGADYRRTCPDLPSGAGAPSGAPGTEY